LSDKYYIAAFAFLPDFRLASTGVDFIPSLISWHNLWAVCVELLLLFPLLLLVVALRRRCVALQLEG